MKKYLAMVKLLFVQQYRIRPIGEKKKRVGMVILLVVLGLCFLPMLASLVAGSYFLGTVAGADTGICSLLLLVCQGLVLVFGTIAVISNVFSSKDADKLLFLPVSTTKIFLAKLTVVYVNEVITSAVTILVALLPFGIGAHATVNYFLMLPFALLFVPVLPLFVGCILAIPISAIMSRLKNNAVVKTVVSLLFFVGIMALYMWMISSIGGAAGDIEGDTSDITVVLQNALDSLREAGKKLVFIHPNFMLATAMTVTTFSSWLLSFFVALLEHAALLGILVLAALPVYRRILSSSLEAGGSSKRRRGKETQLQVKNTGVVRGLIFSDLKRVLRNSQLAIQSFAGLIMMPMLVIVLSFAFNQDVEGGGSLVSTLSKDPLYQAVAPLVIVCYMSMLGIGSNVLGLYPISRENKSLYLLKSLPVSFNKVLLAKVVLATVVMLVCDLLTCVLSVIFFGLNWYYCIAMLLLMSLLGFGGMCVTTLLDLKSPKLGWTNFNQSLKNAKNSWIAMLVGLCVTLAMGLAAALFIVWFVATLQWYAVLLMWIVLVGVAFAFAAVSYKIMTGKATAYFERIEP